MFEKTSSIKFLKYGEAYNDWPIETKDENIHRLNIKGDTIDYMYIAEEDTYLTSVSGIVLLVIKDDIENEDYSEFIFHRIIRIKKGNYFNFISLSESAEVEIHLMSDNIQSVFYNNPYTYQRITPQIHADELVAYYFNVRDVNFVRSMNQSNYWELLYVDSGELNVVVDGNKYTLTKDNVIFLSPDAIYSLRTNDKKCTYLTIILNIVNITSDFKDKICNKKIVLTHSMKRYIDLFITYTAEKNLYQNQIAITALNCIVLELFTSNYYQIDHQSFEPTITPMQQNFENEILHLIVMYINDNIYGDICTVDELCKKFGLSRSSIQNLFNNYLNVSPKKYIINTKLNKSKELLKEGKYSVSEIAYVLGFSSIHYFSRRFKEEYGVNPIEYARRVYDYSLCYGDNTYKTEKTDI